MQKIFFLPGPTQLFPSVPRYIQEAINNNICSISHRGKEFEQIFQSTITSLKKLLGIPNGFRIFFTSSSTENMERVVENCVLQYSYHFINGAFSKRFFDTAQELKKSPEKIEVALGQGFDFSSVEIPERTELICFTQNETSTGVSINMDEIYAIKKKNPDKLIAVDIVSSAPYVDVDYSLVDCAFLSVQKGFGLPAGLGVLIVNDKCIEKARALQNSNCNIGSYHSFLSLLKHEEKFQTPETPNVLGIYLLGKICDEFNNIGIGKIRKDTEIKAEMLYNFFDGHQQYTPFIQNKDIRSKTVVAVNTPNGSQNVIQRLSEKGFVVGTGYRDYKDKQIRIANFPMHKTEDVAKMLKLL